MDVDNQTSIPSPSKRPRLDENEGETASTTRTRHPTLWLDDGNVVLATKATLFCVHRSVLSMHSAFFADMFSLPQPALSGGFKGPEEIKGAFGPDIPVIGMLDSCADIGHMLSALYDRTYYVKGRETPFGTLAGLLRMGTKYQISHLRNDVLDHLSPVYTSTYESYINSLNAKTKLTVFPDFPGQHFAVVALAREVHAEVLLPAAFYKIIQSDLSVVFDGKKDHDGTHYRLTPEDVRDCVIGKERLRAALPEYPFKAVYEGLAENCLSPGACEAHRRTVLTHKHLLPAWLARMGVFSNRAPRQWDKHFCDSCAKHYQESREEGYRNIWSDLPEFFALSDWETLIRMSTTDN